MPFERDSHQSASDSVTSCDAHCARYIPMLMLMPLLGLIAFVFTSQGIVVPWLRTLVDVSGPYLVVIDSVLLPRSNFELPVIQEVFGGAYYNLAVFVMTACSMIGWLVVVQVAVGSFRRADPFEPSKSKYVIVGILVVGIFLVFRHPYTGRLTSVYGDNLDGYGFYFLRETCIIAAGFYNLALIVANLFSFRLAPL